MDLITGLIMVVLGVLGGLIGCFLGHFAILSEIVKTRKYLHNNMNALNSVKAVSKKEELKNAEQAALAQGLAAMQSGKDIKGIISEVVATNPEGAEQLFKKYGKFFN